MLRVHGKMHVRFCIADSRFFLWSLFSSISKKHQIVNEIFYFCLSKSVKNELLDEEKKTRRVKKHLNPSLNPKKIKGRVSTTGVSSLFF
jgi:hypothetical protein